MNVKNPPAQGKVRALLKIICFSLFQIKDFLIKIYFVLKKFC